MKQFKSILVTGGAGFVGSHLVRRMINNYSETQFVNFDALTYSGDLSNLEDCSSLPKSSIIPKSLIIPVTTLLSSGTLTSSSDRMPLN